MLFTLDPQILRPNISSNRIEILENLDVDDVREIFIESGVFSSSMFDEIEKKYSGSEDQMCIVLIEIINSGPRLSINISLTSSTFKFSRISIRLLEIFGLNICGSIVKSIDQCFNSKNIKNNNIGIKVSMHNAFLELPSSGTLNIKIFKI
jgi:hypothetical protein